MRLSDGLFVNFCSGVVFYSAPLFREVLSDFSYIFLRSHSDFSTLGLYIIICDSHSHIFATSYPISLKNFPCGTPLSLSPLRRSLSAYLFFPYSKSILPYGVSIAFPCRVYCTLFSLSHRSNESTILLLLIVSKSNTRAFGSIYRSWISPYLFAWSMFFVTYTALPLDHPFHGWS